MTQAPRLSIAVIAKNEAANLPPLFASLRNLRRPVQWVVVDTGSDDGTADIARDLGAEVLHFPWTGDFSAARNAALDACRAPWILWLDADDRPEPSALAWLDTLPASSSGSEAAAYRFVITNPRVPENPPGSVGAVATGESFRQVRVFPNRPEFRFAGRVHEQIAPCLRAAGLPFIDIPAEIRHEGYADAATRAAKAHRNLELLRPEWEAAPDDAWLALQYGNALMQNGKAAEAYAVFKAPLANRRAQGNSRPEDPAACRLPCLAAEAADAQGLAEEARAWDRLAVVWEPEHGLPAYRLAKADVAQGKPEAALKRFAELARREPAVLLMGGDPDTIRHNAAGFACLLDESLHGAAQADIAVELLPALLRSPLPLPFDAAFPLRLYHGRGDAVRGWRLLRERFQNPDPTLSEIAEGEDAAEAALDMGLWREVLAWLEADPEARRRSGTLEAFALQARAERGDNPAALLSATAEALRRFPEDPTLLALFAQWANLPGLWEKAGAHLLALESCSEECRRLAEQWRSRAEGAPPDSPVLSSETAQGQDRENAKLIPEALSHSPAKAESPSKGNAPAASPPEASHLDLNRNLGTIRAPLPNPHPPGTLTVAMIVKNEAANIGAAVESFRAFADEIVVHDTGSTDGTQAILDRLGVKWFQGEWRDDFSAARNAALERARSAWVIWLDADDRVPPESAADLRKLKTAPLDRAFGFQVINTQGGEALGGRFMQVRMFPNHPSLRFRYRVHEQIQHAIAAQGLHLFYLDTVLHHTGYEDPGLKTKKARRNLELLARESERLLSEPALAMSVGDSHYILGEWEQGIRAYQAALAIPGCREINADVHDELPALIGRGHQQLGRREDALRWFEKSLALRPGNPEPAFYRAECLMELGRLEEAERAFRACADLPALPAVTASQVDSVRIFSLWHASELARRRGAPKEALPLLERLTRQYPQVLEGWMGLGDVLADDGRRVEAEQAYDRAVRQQPRALETLHRRRLANLSSLDDRAAYEAALRSAVEAFPEAVFPTWNSLAPDPRAGKPGEVVGKVPAKPASESPTVGNPDGAQARSGGHTRSTADAKTQPLISLCLIVRDEEKNLGPCLDSVRMLADETIVVDTGSRDGTRALAASRGAKVLDFPWIGDFSAARNHGLEAARGRWVLWLDADDRLEPDQARAIRAAVEQADGDPRGPQAFGLVVKNSGDGGKTGTVFNQIRIFPARPELRFTGRVHEQILPAIEAAGLGVAYWPWRVLHTGYADPAAARAKQVRNRDLLLAQIEAKENVTPVTYYTLGMAYLDLGEAEAALAPLLRAEGLAAERGNNPHVRAQAPVKRAVALAFLGRPREALSALPPPGEPAANPEAALVRAQILASLGEEEEARQGFEALLDLREGPAFIPVDIGLIKLEALKFLGSYHQKRGNTALGLQLLKSGLALRSGSDYTRAQYAEAAYHRGETASQ